MKRGLGILFAAVLSVSAIQFGSAGPSNISHFRSASDNSAKSPRPSDKRSKETQCPDFRDDLLKMIGEFYQLPKKPSDFSAFQPQKAQFLIATLPDPIHTHLSLFFDRNIEMIGQAAQTQGFNFDRQLLPWDNKSHPESTDFRIRDQEKACTDLREDNPGLIIFRPSNGDDALFVFIVGEQPTGGINYPQIRNALEIMGKMSPANTGLRILGPTFSGSFSSLDKILEGLDKRRTGKIMVHSGTVMSWVSAGQFIDKWHSNPNIEFTAFQESDQYRLRHFLRYYIDQHGYLPRDVAELSEGETAYGRVGEKPEKQEAQNQEKETAPREDKKSTVLPADKCLAAENLSDDEKEACVLHLYFPREISQLRSAYQHDIYMDQRTGNTGKSAPRSTLQLDFDNAGNDGDSIPSYSGKQLPVSQESVLLGIVASLKKHHSRFVVLRASDPLDELFLSRFLRQAYPDGQVITLGADLLYSRQEDTLLHGVWAMSTYPLITDLHRMLPILGDPNLHVDRNFPFGYGAGTYNATLSLLAKNVEPDSTNRTCPAGNRCLPRAAYEQYGWPFIGGDASDERLRTPPLWLTVMGRDGYWPMQLLDDPIATTPVNPSSRLNPVGGQVTPRRYEMSSPDSWSVLCGLCVLAAIIHLLLVWSGSSMSRSEAFAQFAPHTNWRRIGLLFLAAISILSALEMLITLDLDSARRFILIVTAVIFTAGCLVDLARRALNAPQDEQNDAQDKKTRPLAAVMLGSPVAHVIWVAGLTAIIYRWGVVAQRYPSSWRIFLYRSVHITSTVSPIVPVFFLVAAVYWCVWHCLSGASLLDRRRPRLPDIPPKSGQAAWLTCFLNKDFEFISFDEIKDLREVAKPFKTDPRIAIPLVISGALAALIFRFKHPVESLEGRTYNYVYAALLFLIIGLLLSNLFRLLTIWLEGRRLLVALDRLPLRRAFRNLHGFSWKPIWRPGGSAFRDSLRMIAREVEGLSHLKSALGKRLIAEADVPVLVDAEERELALEKYQLIKAISALQDNEYKILLKRYHEQDDASFKWKTLLHRSGWRALIKEEPENTAALVKCFRELQQRLAEMCAMALNYLRPKWAEEEGPIANANGRFKPSKDVQIAEEFVALVYSSFIMHILLRMRTIIMCVSGMFIFILFSINSYPFQPQSSFRVLLVGLFIVIGCVVGSVYSQMHRDSTLSLLTDTKPGKLGIDFWIKLAGFGAVPLVSLLASQFPEVNRFLFSWLQPALEALK